MASVGYYDKNGEWSHQCGATLITSSHFLTAAHCLANYTNWKIHVGDFNLGFVKSDPLGVDVEMKKVTKHPNYTGESSYFDAAVIETDTVEFSHTIRKICLPQNSGTKRDYYQVDVLGWGAKERYGKASNVLNLAVQVIYPNEYCNQTHTREGAINDRIKKVVPDLFQSQVLCAGIKSGVHGACKGDSGGPLQFFDPIKGRYFQVGIVHGSVGECGSPEWPAVYANLDDPAVLDFILTAVTTEEDDSACCKDSLAINEEYEEHLLESDWHLIGSRDQRFELFNWKTGEQCFVTESAEDYGYGTTDITILKNVPIFCAVKHKSCYKFLASSRQWVNISSFPLDVNIPELSYVPIKGLVIFSSTLHKVTTQILDDPDAEWKVGPEIEIVVGVDLSCVLQLNKTITVFLSTRKLSFYDWSTNTITTYDIPLTSLFFDCATIKDKEGNYLVAFVSFATPILQIFNLANNRLESEDIPLLGNYHNYRGVGLAAVNNGRDILLYGGEYVRIQCGRTQPLDSARGNTTREESDEDYPCDETRITVALDTIKKFNYATKTWSDLGKLLVPISDPQIVPIHGLKC